MKDRQRIVLLPVEEMLLDIEATLQLMASTFGNYHRQKLLLKLIFVSQM